jgi:hypothetical protein
MVIRNSKLRMNGQDVGGWNDIVNPECARKDVLDLLSMGLKKDLLHAHRSSRKLGVKA